VLLYYFLGLCVISAPQLLRCFIWIFIVFSFRSSPGRGSHVQNTSQKVSRLIWSKIMQSGW